MRYLAGPAAGAAAFAAWDILGPAWAVALLACALAWAAVTLPLAASEKAKATENRVAALVPAVYDAKTTADAALPKAGGTITGNLTVSGDHHVTGTLYGASGSLQVGDQAYFGADTHIYGDLRGQAGTLTVNDNTYVSADLTAQGRMGTHGALWGTSTTGDTQQGSITGNTDGDSQQGSITGNNDGDAVMGHMTGTYVTVANGNSIIDQVNNLKSKHNSLTSDCQGLVNRVNHLITYHNNLVSDCQSLVNRVNDILGAIG